MKLAYLAFDRNGRQVSDTVEAQSVAAASESLRRQGLFVSQIMAEGEAKAPTQKRSFLARTGSKRLQNVAMMMRQMHALVSCGTPLVEALTALQDQSKAGPWRDCLHDVRMQVEEGAPLSMAMEKHPRYFDAVCRSLVAAGESSGTLPDMIDRVANITRKQLHVRNTVIGALIYPILLLGVATAVLSILLGVVIPKFGELFAGLGVPLPPTTQVLLSLSLALQSYWWAAAILAVGLGVAIKLWSASAAGKRMLDTIVLQLPQAGKIARSFSTARIARLLGTLMESHVSILDAIQLTRQSVSNCHYAALLADAEEAVTHGKPISEAFASSDLISPSVCAAIRNGEQNGQVGALLLNVADFLDEENEIIVRSLTSIIEPVILLIMGVLVGTVAVSMFMPLFDLTSLTQGGGG
jgi:type II secretory pathway component PulF